MYYRRSADGLNAIVKVKVLPGGYWIFDGVRVSPSQKKVLQLRAVLFFTYFFSIAYAALLIAIQVLIFNTPAITLNLYVFPLSFGALVVLFNLIPRYQKRIDHDVVIVDHSLHRNVCRIAERLDIAERFETRLQFGLNASAYRTKKTNVVSIGYPLVFILTERELGSVICHELSHHLGGDVRIARLAGKIEAIYLRVLGALNNRIGMIVGGPYRFFARRFFKRVKANARNYEFEADKRAATMFGPHVATQALKKIDLFNDCWLHFCACWLQRSVEYAVSCNVFESFALYVEIIGTQYQECPVKSRASGEYDTHPSVDERLKKIASCGIEDATEVSLEAVHVADRQISDFFWNHVAPGAHCQALDSVRDCFDQMYANVYEKYASIWVEKTFADCNRILDVFSKVSFHLYQIDQVDHYESEKKRLIDVLVACVFVRTRTFNWQIGSDFTPALLIDSSICTLGSIVDDLFEFKASRWLKMLEQVGLNPEDSVLTSTAELTGP